MMNILPKPIPEKSLTFTNPELAKLWDFDKNGTLTPEMFTSGSGQKVWWICEKGHKSFLRTPLDQKYNTYKCPECYRSSLSDQVRKAKSKKGNTLAKINPEISKYYLSNENDYPPNEIGNKSKKKVWWACSNCEVKFQRVIQTVTDSGKNPLCLDCVRHKKKIKM